ncbi:hypothetical protein TSUD_317690 [Trifolium subterraneum]|uniref:Uncharacterized protein n=1 Tax=Trifolium subterraneum TaxID=3900 RepID=A0A2Z6M3P8_TRISU|nr:hypothetical protein TSUD_317690 [Trifolium subterraneum]
MVLSCNKLQLKQGDRVTKVKVDRPILRMSILNMKDMFPTNLPHRKRVVHIEEQLLVKFENATGTSLVRHDVDDEMSESEDMTNDDS